MIYFDNAATTKASGHVIEKMTYMLSECFGNPSSLHNVGFEAEKELNDAKNKFAKILRAEACEIYFTSGGTESNNLALIGLAGAYKRQGNHIISTKTEHASVMLPLKHLSETGFDVTYLETDEAGHIDLENALRLLRDETILISIGHVNSETGTINDINEIGKAFKEKKSNVLIHSDCVQSFGKIPVNINYLDAVSISGHKIHAPKGIGGLYLKKNINLKPILYGGGQQKSLRPGTENMASIAAFSAAAQKAHEDLSANLAYVKTVKENMLCILNKFDGVHINGDIINGSPYILNMTFDGIRGEVLLHALEDCGIYISTGSACSEKYKKAKSKSDESAVRFSFCAYNTIEETNICIETLEEIIPTLRRFIRK